MVVKAAIKIIRGVGGCDNEKNREGTIARQLMTDVGELQGSEG